MVTWPAGIKETPIRKQWFEKICKLPPGLELQKAARTIRQPYAAVRRWGVLFGYKFPDRRRAVAKEQWSKVDWSKRDAEIARELGVTRECVRLVRRSRGMGPSAAQTATRDLSWFIFSRIDELHGLPVEDVLKRANSNLPYHVCRRLLREHGVRAFEPQSPLREMDWRLPNRDLAAIWKIDDRYIANLRARLGVGPANWSGRDPGIRRNGQYGAALAAEKQKFKAHQRQQKTVVASRQKIPA